MDSRHLKRGHACMPHGVQLSCLWFGCEPACAACLRSSRWSACSHPNVISTRPWSHCSRHAVLLLHSGGCCCTAAGRGLTACIKRRALSRQLSLPAYCGCSANLCSTGGGGAAAPCRQHDSGLHSVVRCGRGFGVWPCCIGQSWLLNCTARPIKEAAPTLVRQWPSSASHATLAQPSLRHSMQQQTQSRTRSFTSTNEHALPHMTRRAKRHAVAVGRAAAAATESEPGVRRHLWPSASNTLPSTSSWQRSRCSGRRTVWATTLGGLLCCWLAWCCSP